RTDAGIEIAAVLASIIIEVHRPLDVGCRDGPPERAARNVGQDLGSATLFFRSGRWTRGIRGLAGEHLFARRRFADTGDIVGANNVARAQPWNARRIVRFQAVAKNGLPHVLFLSGTLD